MKGIESRLKITEDRLFQERADRAGKLSEIEEKLLNENAKLHVSMSQTHSNCVMTRRIVIEPCILLYMYKV